MKALLITGTLAQETVRQYAKQSKIETEVLALKTQVAALLSTEATVTALQKHNLQGFDIILTPGLVLWDTKIIADAVKIPAFKGPRYAADLPTVLDSLGKVVLSTVVPACDLLREKLRQKALLELEVIEQNRNVLLKNPCNLQIKKLPVGKDFPMRVLAEIVDAPLMTDKEIQSCAKNFVLSGANIIDVGMLAGKSMPSDAKRAVKAVKAAVDVPVSIDTLNPAEIKAAVEAGADLILSADAGNLKKIAPFAKNVPVVVIPTNQRKGIFPPQPKARVRMLERLIKQAKKLGFERVIGDLILDPSNVADSFTAFRLFTERNPDMPLLIGAANVTELLDADSVGVNALLARLSSEANVGILLVTEKSAKTKGTIMEAATASKMMFLAKKRSCVPKDLGLNLLILKDNTSNEAPYDKRIEDKAKITLAKPQTTQTDPKGIFRVAVDREEKNIVALHYESLSAIEPLNVIKGKTAESVYGEVLALGLVSQMTHAAYLGKELAKAQICLETGKQYVQDAEVFKKILG
jgi:dihydropteroate synthase-like protein